MFGLFLVVLGAIFLMEEMGFIQGDFWGYFWPILLIVFGFKLMSKDNDNNCFSFWTSSSKHQDKQKHKKVVDDQ